MAAANGSFSSPPARHRRRCRCHHCSRAGKGREHSSRPDSPGRVRGGPGPGPRASPGGMAVGRGRMAADGAGFGSSRLPRSLRGWAPTNGPSGQPPPPGVPPTSRLPPRLDTPLHLHKGRGTFCSIPLHFQGCYLKKKAGREELA